jgi:lipoprotein NlpD
MRLNYLFLFLFTFLLNACGSSYQAPVDDVAGGPRYLDSGKTHLVNEGETLYVIAWMYDLDFSALARANNLREPYDVVPGQVLNVDLRREPATTVASVPAVVAGSAEVTTNPVQTTGAIQRAPLPGSGITRRELPSSRTAAPAEPALTVEPPLTAGAPVRLPDNSVPPAPVIAPNSVPSAPIPAPVPAPVPPPVTTIETPQSNTVSDAAPTDQPAPPVEMTLPVETTPSIPTDDVNTPSRPASSAPAETVGQNVEWDWPFRGAIIGTFNDGGVENKGLDLAGKEGDSILAAADGDVVYSGSGLLRYGDLIIIKHNEHFLSAYAHNSALNVKEGDKVRRGQKIAELGSSGIDRNMLHFEIRLDGKPVDPQLYLPAL